MPTSNCWWCLFVFLSLVIYGIAWKMGKAVARSTGRKYFIYLSEWDLLKLKKWPILIWWFDWSSCHAKLHTKNAMTTVTWIPFGIPNRYFRIYSVFTYAIVNFHSHLHSSSSGRPRRIFCVKAISGITSIFIRSVWYSRVNMTGLSVTCLTLTHKWLIQTCSINGNVTKIENRICHVLKISHWPMFVVDHKTRQMKFKVSRRTKVKFHWKFTRHHLYRCNEQTKWKK